MRQSKLTRRALLAGGSLAALSACSRAGSSGSSFGLSRGTVEAGAEVDEGGFGNVTAHNLRQHYDGTSARTALGEKFASSVQTTVNFAFGSSRLDSSAHRALEQQAHFMRAHPEVRFSVFGHTDSVGGAAANERLGKRRAQAVVNSLVKKGISRSRLEALVSFGERQPLVPGTGRERRNRRAVTEVGGFVANNPLVLDGNYAAIVYRNYAFGGG